MLIGNGSTNGRTNGSSNSRGNGHGSGGNSLCGSNSSDSDNESGYSNGSGRSNTHPSASNVCPQCVEPLCVPTLLCVQSEKAREVFTCF